MHRSALTRPALAAMFIASYLGAAATGQAGGYDETDLVVNKSVNGVPTLTDKNGIKHIAKVYDPDLKNPWGISESSTSLLGFGQWKWEIDTLQCSGTRRIQ